MDQQSQDIQEFITEDRSTHDLSMEDLGIKVEAAPQALQQHLESFKNMASLTMSTIFICLVLSTEEYNSLTRDPTTGDIKNLSGSTRMPFFDKMIITYTVVNSAVTYRFHLGEQHVMTHHPTEAYLMMWSTTAERLRNLTTYGQLSHFMRGFLQHQIQLESTGFWVFTALEKATMATFKIKTTDVIEQNLMEINKYRTINIVQHQPPNEQHEDEDMMRAQQRPRLE